MSDISQGPGWWIASDGKWYPPEDHPDWTAGPGATQGGPTSRWSGTSEETPLPSAVSAETVFVDAPAGVSSVDEPTRSGSSTEGAAAFMTTGEGLEFDPSIHIKEARSLRYWVLGAVILVALAVAALIVALRSPAPSGTTLSTGPTTASITVVLSRSGHPTFSGALAGRSLSGTVIGSGETGTTNGGPIAEYRGAFGNRPFDLHVSIRPIQSGQVSFGVTGTYGSQPVTATAHFDFVSATARALTVPFSGHVGAQAITGVAIATPTASNGIQIRATLSVVSSTA